MDQDNHEPEFICYNEVPKSLWEILFLIFLAWIIEAWMQIPILIDWILGINEDSHSV